jgi:hypothetical protein
MECVRFSATRPVSLAVTTELSASYDQVPVAQLASASHLKKPGVLRHFQGFSRFTDLQSPARFGTLYGNVILQAVDRHGQPAAARFQTGAQIMVDNVEPFTFEPDESFTIQSWFQTSSQENQVIAARPGAYSLGVKAGRLSAWIMQDGNQFVEAAGATVAADGQWYHAAAVFDRQTQMIAVYLDGRLDGEPRPIAAIGRSTATTPLMLGAFGGGFPFDGVLDEISIHRAALRSTEFSFSADNVAVPPAKLAAQSGRYTTTTCDWGQPVRLATLRTDATLGDGTITAQVDNDNYVLAFSEPVQRIIGVHERQNGNFGPHVTSARVEGLAPGPVVVETAIAGAELQVLLRDSQGGVLGCVRHGQLAAHAAGMRSRAIGALASGVRDRPAHARRGGQLRSREVTCCTGMATLRARRIADHSVARISRDSYLASPSATCLSASCRCSSLANCANVRMRSPCNRTFWIQNSTASRRMTSRPSTTT